MTSRQAGIFTTSLLLALAISAMAVAGSVAKPLCQRAKGPHLKPKLTYDGAYNGPLFDTQAQVGESKSINGLSVNMKRNGVTASAMYFMADAEDPFDFTLHNKQGVGYAYKMMKASPGGVVAFFHQGEPASETEPGDTLTADFKESFNGWVRLLGRKTLKGFGELEIYGWGGTGVSPTNPGVLSLVSLASQKKLAVMLHPKAGQTAGFEQLLRKYPATTFLVHQYPEDFSLDRDAWLALMANYPNFYYGVDADHMLFDGKVGLLYKYEDLPLNQAVSQFLGNYSSSSTSLLESALARYRSAIEAQPNRFVWGSEAGTLYAYNRSVYDHWIEFSRRFIGQLPAAIQKQFAYTNAVKALSRGIRC